MHQINVSIQYELYHGDEMEHGNTSEQIELQIHQ